MPASRQLTQYMFIIIYNSEDTRVHDGRAEATGMVNELKQVADKDHWIDASLCSIKSWALWLTFS